MLAIRRKATISSRVEDAFEYVADWRNLPNYVPMFVELEATSLVQYGPGTSVDLTMLFGDRVQMRTTMDIVDFIKNRRIVFKSSRGVRTKTAWDFSELGGRALVSLEFDFEVPPTMNLRDEEKQALGRAMEESWGRSLEMLKWVLEGRQKGRA